MADQHATPPSSSRRERDSHDLSLSPRDVTRDSLVTNMLLSLDQFSLAQPTTHHDTSPHLFDSDLWNNDSYSSDFDFAGGDGASSQFSSPPVSRGYRSNSNPASKPGTAAGPSRPGPPVTPRAGTSRRTRRGNSNTSIDTAYIKNNRWGASSSGTGLGESPNVDSTAQQALDADDDDQDDDSAPNPTIASGPRGSASPAVSRSIPPPPPEPVTPNKLQRKQSTTRSLKNSSGRSTKQTTSRPTPLPTAMSVNDLESAPAPSVGYNKSKEEALAGQKEKPGFFRRVFGGSKAGSSMAVASASTTSLDQQKSASPTRNEQRPASNRLQRQTSRGASAPPSRDNTSSHSQNHPALQKKSSSFFRRRKKSVADEAPPLPDDVPPVPAFPPLDMHNKNSKQSNDPPSPVSSLRKVMNPYLRNSAGSAKLLQTSASAPLADITNSAKDHNEARREQFKREFSPDYEPSIHAKIRTVPSDLDAKDAEDSTKGPLQAPAKIFGTKSNSFLNLEGTSDNEEALEQSMEAWMRGRSDSASRLSRERGRDDELRSNKKAQRILGQPGLEDDERGRATLALPADAKRSRSPAASTDTDYKTAPSAAPSVRVDNAEESSPSLSKGLVALENMENMQSKGLDEPMFVIGDPTEDDRQKAQKIYDGSEDFIQKDRAAAWMGEEGPVRKRTLQAYMELYDFTDQSILTALRSVCNRLILRGETQQVDRILVAFSKRWCKCNPSHEFKATDVIHTICYSIMLLNTDLHMADIEQKMTRSQFVKNTMPTVRQSALESNPQAFQRPSILPDKSPLLGSEPSESDQKSVQGSARPPRIDVRDSTDQPVFSKSASIVTMKVWEEQVEAVLKSIYSSIRDDKLPLFGAEPERHLGAPSQSNLSVMGMLKRSPSVISKSPSEGATSSRGRNPEGSRATSSRWTSKSRSRPGLGRTGMASSRTSFDDDSSVWSPAMSSAAWSRYSLGRTQGTMSQDSFASSMPRGDYQQSIGFANALSQAMFRDEDADGNELAPSIMSAEMSSTQLLEDESLELAGPPWVKEGMVMHKHHLDGVGRKAKDRNWTEVFAVVQKGQLSMFSFSATKSSRQKSRPRTGKKITTPVGGGNWQDNAVNLGTFSLRLTLASALPSPGYSRTRPYVWALSLPNGAVHLFQVGTPEIIREFVNTSNYWSARLSTHPLVGGISNIEYGWSSAIVNNALVSAINNEPNASVAESKSSRPSSRATHGRKSSAASGSFRASSLDQVAGAFTNNSGRGKLPGDRMHINVWAAPTQSPRPSNLSEEEQLESLTAYVKNIEDELQSHNQLRSPMLLAFTPRGSNAGKAMANWERKSSYLLREIVKFRTYVDCLTHAETRKKEIYRERDLAHRAARGELSDVDIELSADDDDEADETLKP